MIDGLLQNYKPAQGYDEAIQPDLSPRQAYQRVAERFSGLTPLDLRRIESLVSEEFRRQGITFTVYGDDEGTERTWPMDLFPRIIEAADWALLERGLAQRVTALNRFLEDLYVGESAAMHDGIVPSWLVTSSKGWH